MTTSRAHTSTPMAASVRDFTLRYGFNIILVAVFVFFALTAPRFLALTNLISLLHAAAPMMVIASGLAVVVMTGKLDISVGSVAFLTASIGTLLIVDEGFQPVAALAIMLLVGTLIGALNGFIITVLRVNPLITTLAMMVALRGVALELTQSTNIALPVELRRLGNVQIGPVFVDILIALGIMLLVHVLITRAQFGRQIMAIGNDSDAAARLGVRVDRVTFLAFVLSAFLATIGGILTVLQVGAVSRSIGNGYEFVAMSVVIIGGISLFGGEGSILPGVLRGVLILEIIRNGLNQLAVDPYAYRFVNGAIIFIAMYADSLRSRLPTWVRVYDDEEDEIPDTSPDQASLGSEHAGAPARKEASRPPPRTPDDE
jgi:ribose/xylose/arabinose/galactoside ABC-type transport system permease subunit